MSKHNWLIAEIELQCQNSRLFEKSISAEEIERLETAAENAEPRYRAWCKRKIEELKQ